MNYIILSVNSLNTQKYGTILKVWYVGGERRLVRRPFDPYFFSTIKIPHFKNEEVTLKDLATFEQLDMFKTSFRNTNQLRKNVDMDFTTRYVPYIQQVAIDEGFYYKSKLPDHRAFDIETWKGKITAIGVYGYGKGEFSAGSNERAHIEFLNDQIKQTDPDILDTYWGSYFDVLKTQERAKAHNIQLAWGRKGVKPYIKRRKYRRGPHQGIEHIVRLEGRLHFDVWKEVDLDQTLSGIKNKKLKTVAKWFKLKPPIIEVEYESMDELTDETLGTYCLNDARLTWLLAEIYLHRLYYHAESRGLPLNLLLERTPSHLINYIYSRDMNQLGIVSRGSNQERFPQFFLYGRKAYQGAVVRLYRAGIYGLLFHDDFKSMYPTIMGVFNLSPETVHLVKVRHIECTGLERPKFNGRELTFYDNKVGEITVRIDEEEGVTRQHIREWMSKRNVVKAKLKKDLKNPILESEQYGLKVNLNKAYGYHGMRFAKWGCAPIAAVITAMGRWWLWESVEQMENRNCIAIESDTDGIYHVGEDMSKQLTTHIKTLIPELYDSSFIKIDNNKYDGGIFYEEKGYLLKDGDNIKFKGSGLKGRHMPSLVDTASMEVAQALFAGIDPKKILWKYTRQMKSVPFKQFLMTVELHQESYEEKSMYYKLLDVAKRHGIKFAQGSEIRYVKTTRGYVPYPLPNYEYKLDYSYYRERMANVLARFLGPTKRLGKMSINKILKEGQMTF